MKYTNKHNIPSSVFEALVKNTYDVSYTKKDTMSISMLNSPPRIRQLSLRHWDELEADISEKLWILLGSAIHEVLSRVSKKDRIIEERMTEPVMGYNITGKPDLYDIKNNSIEDYKITSVWAVKEIKTEWEQQLNCYCWFLRKLGYVVKSAYINAILRDWNKHGLRNPDYPRIPFKRLEIPIWTFEEQEKYIKKRLRLHIKEAKKEEADLVLCSKEERWATQDKYAAYKGTNKKATKLFTNKKEAEKFTKTLEKGRVQFRPGEDIRCKSYCPVSQFCSYYKEKYGGLEEGQVKEGS